MSPRCRFTALFTLAAVSSSLPAQFTGTAVVAARTPAGALLWQVDLATGQYTLRPTFPSDTLPPLAVTADPTDRSLLLAVASGSQSRIVRLPTTGGETILGSVNGTCCELLVDPRGDVVVVTSGATGGVHRLPRHGGNATLLRSVPFASAAGTAATLAWSAIVTTDGTAGPPPRDPGIAEVELDGGQSTTGPVPFPAFTPLVITGLLDLPTAVPRHVLAHDDGTFSLYLPLTTGNPLPVASSPVLPAGGVVAMKTHDRLIGLVLGSVSSPYLRAFDPYTALGTLLLTTVAGPLPGDPVDYALLPDNAASALTFAGACGTAAELRIGAIGLPRPGNLSFALGLRQALPQQGALLALGLAESAPVPMPNGCGVRVVPMAVLFHLTDGNGAATQAVPVPNQAGLIGLQCFGQWFQLDGALPFMTSALCSVRVGT